MNSKSRWKYIVSLAKYTQMANYVKVRNAAPTLKSEYK